MFTCSGRLFNELCFHYRIFNKVLIRSCRYGLKAGHTANVTFVYLGRLPAWEDELSEEMRARVLPERDEDDMSTYRKYGEFSRFPWFITVAGGLDHRRANLLANMQGWSIKQNAGLFKRMLGANNDGASEAPSIRKKSATIPKVDVK